MKSENKDFTIHRRLRRGFVGYEDADPSNISAVGRGAEMRVAENPGRGPSPSESLRSGALFRRRARSVFRSASAHRAFIAPQRVQRDEWVRRNFTITLPGFLTNSNRAGPNRPTK